MGERSPAIKKKYQLRLSNLNNYNFYQGKFSRVQD